jgi:sugar lactone lactonase YvrE
VFIRHRPRRLFPPAAGLLTGLLALAAAGPVPAAAAPAAGTAGRAGCGPRVLVSSTELPALTLPEGVTAWGNRLFVGTYNYRSAQDNRLFVFDVHTGRLVRVLGGRPGEELISAGALLGLAVDRRTGDLYANSNGTGHVLRIQRPDSDHPLITVVGTFSSGGGPEDMAFDAQGDLYTSDSNLGLIYRIRPGSRVAELVVGPAGSGAPISDNGLFAQRAPGLAPNGLVFSRDFGTLYAANTDTDAVIALDVDPDGDITGNARVFARYPNPDLELFPTGFESIIGPDTRFGATATTPLNGPDGLALDARGNVWAASVFGDNVTVLDGLTGHADRMLGSSQPTQGGLLNAPASITFHGRCVYVTNLGIFSDGTNGNPLLPWSVVVLPAGVRGAGGNGNW